MFPDSSGIYIAQRQNKTLIVKIKGIYPAFQLDKNAFDLGEFLRTGKKDEVPKETLDNIELFHNEWTFHPLRFINFGVFSKTEFYPDGSSLYMSVDDLMSIRGMYFRLCEQGVPATKIVRALAYEFKCSTDQIISLVNEFDKQQ